MSFRFENMPLEGLRVVEPFYVEDERGYFLKSFEKEIFLQNGISMEPFESFESLSSKGVLRGLHFQSKSPQAKLVRVLAGEIYDVAVDLRKDSATFGKWLAVQLSQVNRKMLYIPPGFAHGFLVLSDSALVSYICAGQYIKEYDTGIIWNDPDIGISWPISDIGQITISERDRSFCTLAQFTIPMHF